jgi:hypothetical protein
MGMDGHTYTLNVDSANRIGTERLPIGTYFLSCRDTEGEIIKAKFVVKR